MTADIYSTPSVTSIADAITSGTLDSSLAEIQKAIDERTSSLRKTRTVDDYAIGSQVRFNNYCGTAYLRGLTAVVVGKARTKLRVVLDTPVGRFVRIENGIAHSVEISVPTSIVDPV